MNALSQTYRVKQRFPLAPWLVAAMAGYQWCLCFVSTNIMSTSEALVAATEALILTCAGLAVCRSRYAGAYVLSVMGLLAYFGLIFAVRAQPDLEAVRNLLLPLTFFFLGKKRHDRETVARLVWFLVCLVLAGAAGEYFFTEPYLRFFNIQHYYIDRGYISGSLDYISSNVLFNGERFAGRNILPFLGNQRISSIFLEPVSMGNFAVLLAAWGLSFPAQEKSRSYRYLAAAVICIVAADSRFASLMLAALIMVRFTPPLRKQAVLLAAPVIAVAMLLAAALLTPGAGIDDNLHGRMVRSGQALLAMDPMQWLGLGKAEQLGDMGMAYSIEHFGVLMVALLAAGLALLRMEPGQGSILRAMAVYYAVGILMVSGTSFYSAKTAALLWFMLGSLSQVRPVPALSGGAKS